MTQSAGSKRSPDEVRSWFSDAGVSVTDWARDNGFPRQIVYSLLAGRIRGYRGIAHEAALALGLKQLPTCGGPPGLTHGGNSSQVHRPSRVSGASSPEESR